MIQAEDGGGRNAVSSLSWLSYLAVFAATAVAAPVSVRAEPSPQTVIAVVDLSGPFATRSQWKVTASQGPPINDPTGVGDDKVSGEINLCLHASVSGPCDPQLQTALGAASSDDLYSAPHYLNEVRVVHGVGGLPLLFVQTASVHSVDGDQIVLTQALAYERGADRFVRVYSHPTGRNNSQEVRFIEAGVLKGDIISVEPTANAPFGFWISVNTLARGSSYKQVLRYRSATGYGDGNPLAVIDSEMPNIEQRLGLWRAGSPLPLPAGACPTPHLVHMELWCR